MGGFLQPEWCVSTTFDIIYFTNTYGPYKRRKFRGEHLIKFTAISYEIDCFSLAPLLPLSLPPPNFMFAIIAAIKSNQIEADG